MRGLVSADLVKSVFPVEVKVPVSRALHDHPAVGHQALAGHAVGGR